MARHHSGEAPLIVSIHYLQRCTTRGALVDWAERAMMDEDFDSDPFEPSEPRCNLVPIHGVPRAPGRGMIKIQDTILICPTITAQEERFLRSRSAARTASPSSESAPPEA